MLEKDVRIVMKKTQNLLFDLENLSQLVVINDDIYVTKSQLREKENDTHHAIYRVIHHQLELVADDAWLPQNSHGKLAYLQNIAGKAQVFVAGVQVTNHVDGVSHFVASGTSDVFHYLTIHALKPAITPVENVPKPRRITAQMYKADGHGLVDEQTIYRIYEVSVSEKTERERLHTTRYTKLLSQNHEASEVIMTQTDDISGLSSKNQAYILAKNGKTTEITSELVDGFVQDAVYSPDDKQVALVAHDHLFKNTRIFSIYFYDLATKKLTQKFNQDVDAVQSTSSDVQFKKSSHGLIWLDETTLEFIATYHGYNRIYRLTLSGDVTLVSDERQSILALTKNHIIESTTAIPSRILTRSGHIIYEPKYQSFLTEADKFTFESEDGRLIDGWFMKAHKTPAPILLYIHGGPHAAYSDAFFWEFQQFNQAGYHVVFVNPHGSTSYGQAFAQSVIGNYGTIDYRDIMSGLAFAQKKFSDVVDSEHVFLAGGSYGGFMTTWIIGHNQKFTAAVAQRPVINWISLFGTSDIGVDFTTNELELDLRTSENVNALWQLSPLAYAKHVNTPILLLHGEYDLRTPIGQSEEYFSAIKTQTDTPIEFVRLPQSFHGVGRTGKPNLRLARLENMLAWFKRFS